MIRILSISLAFLVISVTPVAALAKARTPAEGRHGMVVSTHHDAARAGHAMLERGGNAVDAAVATAFAVGVTQPFSAGVGGGAFLTIRLASGETVALDARETAPAAADRDMYVREGVPEKASLFGPLAVATPGFVAGMALARRSATPSTSGSSGPGITRSMFSDWQKLTRPSRSSTASGTRVASRPIAALPGAQ